MILVAFFKSYPDQDQAKEDTASHIHKFWDRSMRVTIKKHVTETSLKRKSIRSVCF